MDAKSCWLEVLVNQKQNAKAKAGMVRFLTITPRVN